MVTLPEILLVYMAIVVTLIFYALTRRPAKCCHKDEQTRQEIMDKLNRAIADIKSTV